MNIGMALSKAEKILRNAESMTPALDAGVILCFVLGCGRAYLLSHHERELGSDEERKFFELVAKRAAGTPIQHITGYKEFMSLDFRVNPHVLIPRPETEILTEAVLEYAKRRISYCASGKHMQILDLGTGSGCIAISLAHYLARYVDNFRNNHGIVAPAPGIPMPVKAVLSQQPQDVAFSITASDISAEALEVAKQNAVANDVADKITFVLSNLFENLQNVVFDIIVSNPPYVPSREIQNLQVEVKDHEPLVALDGGEDGLYYYRKIIGKSPRHLNENGLLALEAGYNQAAVIAQMMEGQGFKGIEIIKDLAGIDRVVLGTWIP